MPSFCSCRPPPHLSAPCSLLWETGPYELHQQTSWPSGFQMHPAKGAQGRRLGGRRVGQGYLFPAPFLWDLFRLAMALNQRSQLLPRPCPHTLSCGVSVTSPSPHCYRLMGGQDTSGLVASRDCAVPCGFLPHLSHLGVWSIIKLSTNLQLVPRLSS